jgi:DNA polymerase-3 subunit epsilon
MWRPLGLEDAFAVQIAAVARDGTVLLNEYVDPLTVIAPAAIAVHGITPQHLVSAAPFARLLPALADVLHGRTVLSYNMSFDRGVLERELVRHHGTLAAAGRWLARCRWEDAMVPYAVWKGLWSVKRGAYRNQRLGGPHDAVADCRILIAKTEQMATISSAGGASYSHRMRSASAGAIGTAVSAKD